MFLGQLRFEVTAQGFLPSGMGGVVFRVGVVLVENVGGVRLLVLVRYEEQGLCHVLHLFGVQVAVAVHVEYLEADCKKNFGKICKKNCQNGVLLTFHPLHHGAPAGGRDAAAELLEVHVVIAVDVQS